MFKGLTAQRQYDLLCKLINSHNRNNPVLSHKVLSTHNT